MTHATGRKISEEGGGGVLIDPPGRVFKDDPRKSGGAFNYMGICV